MHHSKSNQDGPVCQPVSQHCLKTVNQIGYFLFCTYSTPAVIVLALLLTQPWAALCAVARGNRDLKMPIQYKTFLFCISLAAVQLAFLNHLLCTMVWAVIHCLLAARKVNDKQFCAAWFLCTLKYTWLSPWHWTVQPDILNAVQKGAKQNYHPN